MLLLVAVVVAVVVLLSPHPALRCSSQSRSVRLLVCQLLQPSRSAGQRSVFGEVSYSGGWWVGDVMWTGGLCCLFIHFTVVFGERKVWIV